MGVPSVVWRLGLLGTKVVEGEERKQRGRTRGKMRGKKKKDSGNKGK